MAFMLSLSESMAVMKNCTVSATTLGSIVTSGLSGTPVQRSTWSRERVFVHTL